MFVTQKRSKNRIVTHIKGFHAVYPSTPVFERHRSVCSHKVVSYEAILWSSLFPNEGGYDDTDWEVTVVRRPRKAKVVSKTSTNNRSPKQRKLTEESKL